MSPQTEVGPAGGESDGAMSDPGATFKLGSTIPADADVRCSRCGRPLHSETAVARGIGWRCRARLEAEARAVGITGRELEARGAVV